MATHISDGDGERPRPPKEHQFKPGQSGNKRGRPKGRLNMATIVERVARERHGQYDTISLLLKRLQARALKGELGFKKFLDWIRDRYEPEVPKVEVRGLIIPPTATMEEFEKELEVLRARHAWIERERERQDAEFRQSRLSPPDGTELLGKP